MCANHFFNAIIFSIRYHNVFWNHRGGCSYFRDHSNIIIKAAAVILDITMNVSDHFQGAAAAISKIITKGSEHFHRGGCSHNRDHHECIRPYSRMAAALSEFITKVSDHFQVAAAAIPELYQSSSQTYRTLL